MNEPTTRPRPTLAKIVATVGPSCDAPDVIARLIDAGVSVFRLNFSHGTLAEHERRVKAIRAAAAAKGQPTAILGDLQGPKIRVGVLERPIALERGQEVVFTAAPETPFAPANSTVRLPTEYAALADEVEPGHRVLINDGAIRLFAVEPEPGDGGRAQAAAGAGSCGVLRCRVMAGGVVSSRKGINLPDSNISAGAITDQDWKHVEWAVSLGLDFLALSFVRRAEEVMTLRAALVGLCPIDRIEDRAGAGAAIPVVGSPGTELEFAL